MTKNALETALDAEMAEHLGYDKHCPAGRCDQDFQSAARIVGWG